jgi:hypothetical protein
LVFFWDTEQTQAVDGRSSCGLKDLGVTYVGSVIVQMIENLLERKLTQSYTLGTNRTPLHNDIMFKMLHLPSTRH